MQGKNINSLIPLKPQPSNLCVALGLCTISQENYCSLSSNPSSTCRVWKLDLQTYDWNSYAIRIERAGVLAMAVNFQRCETGG